MEFPGSIERISKVTKGNSIHHLTVIIEEMLNPGVQNFLCAVCELGGVANRRQPWLGKGEPTHPSLDKCEQVVLRAPLCHSLKPPHVLLC